VELATLQAVPHGDQFDLAHGPLQAQDETVVGVVGIIQPVLVGQERPEDGTDLQEMIPVLGRAREPAQLQPQDQADMIHRDLGEEPLEAKPLLGGPAAPALILVDGQDPILRPTEGRGVVRQGILTLADSLWSKICCGLDWRT